MVVFAAVIGVYAVATGVFAPDIGVLRSRPIFGGSGSDPSKIKLLRLR